MRGRKYYLEIEQTEDGWYFKFTTNTLVTFFSSDFFSDKDTCLKYAKAFIDAPKTAFEISSYNRVCYLHEDFETYIGWTGVLSGRSECEKIRDKIVDYKPYAKIKDMTNKSLDLFPIVVLSKPNRYVVGVINPGTPIDPAFYNSKEYTLIYSKFIEE